ncbi:hypothetical protein F0919_11420 [Taibaiella lutea]|uniref:Uncharacterized protein n=1 Tax=Taibaiella lutea TaxID=2608001 RepID=A0A5M6CGW3_9BACT|nr:hypothetical protein [Taibaiella lutea]KAA5533152.1 hypothetical protein F0919_11420 [Taibaiella lutea]
MNCALMRLVIVIFFIGILSSCKDKEREMLLQEINKRLEQQNFSTANRNHLLRNFFISMEYKDYRLIKVSYLKRDAKDFFKITDAFLSEIANSKKPNIKPDKQLLYKNYTLFIQACQHFKKRIIDSSDVNLPKININGFMNLDEKQFNQKYVGNKNLKDANAVLSLLEADVLMNESAFLESVIFQLEPISPCGDSQLRAIATPGNSLYKKGDKLKIISLLVQYLKHGNMYAVINRQKIEPKDGIFEYSRIITESPGTYKVPIEITINENDRQEVYPAEVTYRVE